MMVPFALDSISFGVAALLVLSLRGSFRVPRAGPPTRLGHEIREGLQWLWAHRLIRSLAIMLGIWNLVSTATGAILVLFALEVLHLHDVAYGLLFTAWAAGGLVGSFVATRIIGRLGHARALLGTVVVGAATSAGIGLGSSPWLVGALLAVEGVAIVVWNVITVSARQALVPPALFGRVNSVYRFVGWGVMPVGAALGGVLAKTIGLRAPYLLAAAVLVVMAVLARRVIAPRSFDAVLAAARGEPGEPGDRPGPDWEVPDLPTGPGPGQAP
jgi:MFS family permease